MAKDITIVIPAFNEEKNIASAIESVTAAIADIVSDYEIIVVNDGSRDRTGAIADEKARANPRIKVLHNETNRGYGYTFGRGVGVATKSYITGFPGDNDASSTSLEEIVQRIGEADLIFSYMSDTRNRSLLRRFISKFFVIFMNFLFGLRIKYYNGLILAKRSTLQGIPIKSKGLAAIAECIVRMVKSGCSYKEIGFQHTGRQAGKSTAFRLNNIASVLETIMILVKDIYFSSPKTAKST